MKKILITTIALLLQLCIFGQTQKNDPRLHSKIPGEKEAFWKDQFEDIKNNAEFVFEGVVQRQDIYPRTNKKGIEFCAGSYIIKITRVFRGHLKPGTVELVTTISPYSATFEMPTQRKTIGIEPSDSVYLFFCKNAKNDYPSDPEYNIDQVSNKTIVTDANTYVQCMEKLPTITLFRSRIPGVNTTFDFYKYICTLPHIDKSVLTKADTTIMPDTEPAWYSKTYTMEQVDSARHAGGYSHKKKALVSPKSGNSQTNSTLKAGVIDAVSTDSVSLRNEAIKKTYEFARKKSLTMFAAGSQYEKRSANSFNATIVNQTTTNGGDGTAYYEFDVQATVNNPNLYYCYSSIDILLPSSNFNFRKNNVDDASKVTVTSYSDDYQIGVSHNEILATNELSLFHMEKCNDDMSIGIYKNPNRHKINGSELLYHVKIELDDCGSSFQITNNNAGLEYAAYSNSQTTMYNWISYDTFTATNPTAFTLGCSAVTGIAIDEPDIIVTAGNKTINIDAGSSVTDFSLSILPSDIATYSSVTWSVNGATNISVTQDVINNLAATVTATTSGKATLTATLVSTNGTTYTDNVVITVHPVITSITAYTGFNIANLSAGDDQMITIIGKGFGSYVQNISFVSFTSTDDGGKAALPDYDNYDYTQCSGCIWADDHITMFLPAMVTSKNGTVISTTSIGTGNVNVGIATNNMSNPYKLDHINHNYNQTVFSGYTAASGTKYKLKPHDTGANVGLYFRLYPSSSSFTAAESLAIDLAMRNWSCKLQLNIGIDPNSTNVIKKGSIAEAMLTQPLNPAVFPGFNDVFSNNITITIDNTSTTIWNTTLPNSGVVIPTNCNSYYYDMLHELGHALQIGHVNNPDDLMYFQSDNKTDLTNPLGDNYALVDAQTRVTASETSPLFWLTAPTIAIPCPALPVIPIIKGFTGSVISINVIQLNWLEADPTATVTITRNDGTNTVTILTTTGASTSFIDNGVTVGKTYTYTISATDTWGTVTAIAAASTTPPVISPTNEREETITWPPIPGATGYLINRSTSPLGPFYLLPNGTVSSGTTSLNDNTVNPGETYYYKVITTFVAGSSVSQIIQANTCINSTGVESVAIIPEGTYANGTLTSKQGIKVVSSSAIFLSGATVAASASQTIGFGAGFSVKSGATMTAHIVPLCGTTKSALVDNTTIINGKELEIDSKIKIYPNPTKGLLTIQIKDKSFVFEMYNFMDILLKKDEANNQIQIDLNNFVTGSYLLKITTDDNLQQTFTILKE